MKKSPPGFTLVELPVVSVRKRPAFTLVELLVVIGIIAVLVAMLLPALNRAKQQAYTVQCLSNMRQLGAVLFIYCADHQGMLPYSYIWSNAAQAAGTVYDAQLLNDNPMSGLMAEGYLPKGNPVLVYRGLTSAYNWTCDPARNPCYGIYAPPCLICPGRYFNDVLRTYDSGSVPVYRTYAVGHFRDGINYALITDVGADEGAAIYSYDGIPPNAAAYSGNFVFANYMFNTQQAEEQAITNNNQTIPIRGQNVTINNVFGAYSDGTNVTGYQMSHPPSPLSKVKNSGNTWLAFDGGGGFFGNQYLTAQGAAFRHLNLSCNFLYFDGHAENVAAADMDGGNASNVNNPAYASPISGASWLGWPLDMRMIVQTH